MPTLMDFFLVESIQRHAKEVAGHYEPASLTNRMYPFLDPEQEIAYRWQMGLFGDFWMSFLDTIHRADGNNLQLLFKGFPVETAALRMFYTVNGWYPHIEQLVKDFKKGGYRG